VAGFQQQSDNQPWKLIRSLSVDA